MVYIATFIYNNSPLLSIVCIYASPSVINNGANFSGWDVTAALHTLPQGCLSYFPWRRRTKTVAKFLPSLVYTEGFKVEREENTVPWKWYKILSFCSSDWCPSRFPLHIHFITLQTFTRNNEEMQWLHKYTEVKPAWTCNFTLTIPSRKHIDLFSKLIR